MLERGGAEGEGGRGKIGRDPTRVEQVVSPVDAVRPPAIEPSQPINGRHLLLQDITLLALPPQTSNHLSRLALAAGLSFCLGRNSPLAQQCIFLL